MGEIIQATAKAERIVEDITLSHERGMAKGGVIADACGNRLGPAVSAIESASGLLEAARRAESAAWVIVLARDSDADDAIGAVRDEMWNAVGRVRDNEPMGVVFPGGIGTYTAGDPRNQPILMQILHSRILAGSAPQWTESKRHGWAATIEAIRIPYVSAVETHRPTEAALTVAEAGYRAAVRAGHARLRSFKRDLKNLGLTEAQIHEIIPDAGV